MFSDMRQPWQFGELKCTSFEPEMRRLGLILGRDAKMLADFFRVCAICGEVQ
jgi:hypothetical protein